MSGTTDLDRGRAAYAAHRWREAAESLAAADRVEPLQPGDLELLAWSYGLSGQTEPQLATLERMHDESVEHGDLRAAARAAFWLGFQLSHVGERGRASGWLGSAQRLLDRAGEECSDCVERGYLLLTEGLGRLARNDSVGAREVGRQVSAIGERFHDADLASLGRALEGQAVVASGEHDAGLALLDEACLPATTGRLGPLATGLVYCATIGCCRKVWAMDRAREWSAALASWCDAQPDLVEFNGPCRVYRAEILQLQGEWKKAMAELQRAARAVAAPAPADRAGVSYQQGELLRLTGQLEAADEAYREASRLGREPQPGLALLRMAQGRADAAATAIRQAIAAAPDPFARVRYLPTGVEILLATRDLEGAEGAARDLEAIAAGARNEILDAMAGHARGAMRLATGDASGALAPLRSAFETWQRVGAPYIAARIRVLVAEALQVLGDADGAELERDAALAVFNALGAAPDIARLQAPPTRGATDNPFGLTARELEVLRLVSSGLTNRAIAKELFLSEKTIDRHVSNIFTKLDVPTRTAASAAAYRHKLV